ncbi:MAG: hypothetical protein AAGB15_01490 [Pseudomonadota bacterium]
MSAEENSTAQKSTADHSTEDRLDVQPERRRALIGLGFTTCFLLMSFSRGDEGDFITQWIGVDPGIYNMIAVGVFLGGVCFLAAVILWANPGRTLLRAGPDGVTVRAMLGKPYGPIPWDHIERFKMGPFPWKTHLYILLRDPKKTQQSLGRRPYFFGTLPLKSPIVVSGLLVGRRLFILHHVTMTKLEGRLSQMQERFTGQHA